MKVLIISMDSIGEGLAFALRCVKAGHAVRLHLSPTANKTIGEGFKGVEKVTEWTRSVKWADLILPTGNHAWMGQLDRMRKDGANVFGPSPRSAKLEIDRKAGMDFLTQHGIECPAFKTFKTLKEAEAHVRKSEGRYVFKPLGDEDDKSLSYCSDSPADMIARLQHWQRLGMSLKGECMLQEFIEGIEFAVSRWVGKEGFIGQANENFERKKLLSGDCGPNCGEAGTILKYVEASKIADEVLEPLEDSLVALGHLGDIDVNCIIDEKGKAWPLEFTARLGWPAFNIMCALHTADPVEWMRDACSGGDTLEVSPKTAAGVVLAQPDYPYSNLTKKETDGIPIYGVTKQNAKYISAQSVRRQSMPAMSEKKLVEEPTWVSAGDYLAVVTGTARTVSQACERAYATLKELHVPDGMYRDDIGEALKERIPKLKAQGFATEFEY
jgi:phosphoribosylamine--glycine ligase